MADVPVPSLSRARELKIEELSNHFANDDLSLEDLEHRIERVYKAASVAELETITADLRAATLPPDAAARPARAGAGTGTPAQVAAYESPNARMLSIMSAIKRVGHWTVPRHLDLLAIMSDTRLDLTQAVLPPGLSEMELRVVMASVRIIVPPGVRVVMDLHSVMADVGSRADDTPRPAGDPELHITGFAFMAEVKVVIRRREELLLETS